MATPTGKPEYLRLSCEVQRYAWGKVGMESEVARLKKASEGDRFTVDQNQAYAEVRGGWGQGRVGGVKRCYASGAPLGTHFLAVSSHKHGCLTD